MSLVAVQDYDPAWPEIFQALRARIWPAVSDIALAIHHVGSTAIPGLAAKPVIDLDVVVPAGHVDEGIARLEALEYEHRGDLGIPDREAFTAPAGLPRHHLYLCPRDSEALANHLAVRDALRRSPGDARAYGELKKALAGELREDIDGYIEAKSEFLLTVLERSGFSQDALENIRRMNARQGDRRT